VFVMCLVNHGGIIPAAYCACVGSAATCALAHVVSEFNRSRLSEAILTRSNFYLPVRIYPFEFLEYLPVRIFKKFLGS
jgi:hypothetical protein